MSSNRHISLIKILLIDIILHRKRTNIYVSNRNCREIIKIDVKIAEIFFSVD